MFWQREKPAGLGGCKPPALPFQVTLSLDLKERLPIKIGTYLGQRGV